MSDFRHDALHYHELPKPGKLETALTKPCETQRDLSLAYSPGVAEPVREIQKNPDDVYRYTGKGNLVAVITNGTAVLGLGDTGALASKPVMEGKGMLFKRFANIDVFDIEVDCSDTDELVQTIANIAPTFGGINLEDIAAPQCFEVEQALKEKVNIPVFHDDQHGTAIVSAAGLLNALKLQDKKLHNAKIVCVGAGAAGLTCMHLLIELGAEPENILLVDRNGVVTTDRDDLNIYKQPFARDTDKVTLADAMKDADVFFGVSDKDILTAEMLMSMAEKPIVFAMANPDPEINPNLAMHTRKDLIMATGRSDYPNQVNNVLGFPYIFRGALDVRATEINMPMKIAAVHALQKLAQTHVPKEVIKAYGLKSLEFGPEYIIPKPNDPRLFNVVSNAVSEAAVKSGVARLPMHAKVEEFI
ncbi:malic enzyme-like NAD(P)-binding protein [Thiomicrorhabdus sp. ZW0627]|uniref:malic enzyme-like NAD(P)-binding protein n=1 Tax=Thiomicrorhabdus sp. ZW0627 TaxID=3039774 RepID=UPI0024364393|nr:malic enzyme-like NAD(P)-binding protein [Thiomicrorhabdus sp. ZW0627]MDG6774385.1 malic enzyme-like NAD(P)-binding protein [Thiomicrorhabdus sp. ZW0627]